MCSAAQKNAPDRVATGFSFASDWLKIFFNQSVKSETDAIMSYFRHLFELVEARAPLT